VGSSENMNHERSAVQQYWGILYDCLTLEWNSYLVGRRDESTELIRPRGSHVVFLSEGGKRDRSNRANGGGGGGQVKTNSGRTRMFGDLMQRGPIP
jgi:hypothetical protein